MNLNTHHLGNIKRMKKLIAIILVLSGCNVEPDFTKDGHEYIVRKRCIKSHTESKYGYHWGYNFMNGKHDWHMGYYTETICDEYIKDTIEVNKK